MKRYSTIISILSLVSACLITAGCATQPGAATAPPPNSGHLIVNRIANFGSDLSLVLSVDGRDVASLTEGRSYDGYLTAATHTLSARVDPNPGGVGPWRKSLTVQAGQTYSYTGDWSSGNLKLIRNP